MRRQTTDWSPEKIESFQAALAGWFREEGADYPWRRTRDPYAILVSELMLQQTRIRTVLDRGYYERWMEAFPDLESLAAAGEDAVLKAWEGLGYYNRARHLRKAAREIVEKRGGRFPESLGEILALPGVGRYTAGAVSSFAFGKSAPIVDGNVIRVFSRLFLLEDPADTAGARKRFWDLAESLTPGRHAREFNSGLMELGQTICVRGVPACLSCPVRDFCRGRAEEADLAALPRKAKRAGVTEKTERVGFYRDGGRIFLERETGRRRRGLWRFPEIGPGAGEELFSFSYSITRFRVNLVVCRAADRPGSAGEWFEVPAETDDLAMPSPYRKALARLQAAEFGADTGTATAGTG